MTTHPDLAALLHAVCEFPDDDTPRLVCADWLDEHAEHERAEFIRAQVAIARIDRGEAWGSDKDEYRRAEKSQRKYANRRVEWSGIKCRWCEGAKKVPALWAPGHGGQAPVRCTNCTGTGAAPVEFARGFVWRVRCRMDDVLREGYEPCPDCEQMVRDRRGRPGGAAQPRCGKCDGGARRAWTLTPWAKGVLAAHPVTRWEIVDREPAVVCSDGVYWYGWNSGEGDIVEPYRVPSVVIDAFIETAWYPTEAEARDALARAVGRVARRLAGLREVPT